VSIINPGIQPSHIHQVIAIPAPRKYPILFATDIFLFFIYDLQFNFVRADILFEKILES